METVNKGLGTSNIPVGVIVAWYGQLSGNFDETGKGINAMEGWALCNSKNDTPDLQDRFVVGAGHDHSFKMSGGSSTVSLTVAELPSHKHTIVGVPDHKHELISNVDNFGNNYVAAHKSGHLADYKSEGGLSLTTKDAGAHTHDMGTTGDGKPFEILPPYYALYYIMKIS